MAIEIVSFPIKNGGSFHSYVSLPEGKPGKLLAVVGLKTPNCWQFPGDESCLAMIYLR